MVRHFLVGILVTRDGGTGRVVTGVERFLDWLGQPGSEGRHLAHQEMLKF